jgi:lipopolysaccharide biosynthesis glycosyltransferase
MNGALIVAYGANARREATYAIDALAEHMPGLPVAVISDSPLGSARWIFMDQRDKGARWAKLNLDNLTPFDHTLYMDADTRVNGDLSAGFGILCDGWDIAIATSDRQRGELCWQCAEDERQATRQETATEPLGLQAGVMFAAKNDRTTKLFATWRREWERWQGQDQGALLRALYASPARVWLLGRDWNGGKLVTHRFGMARAA